MIRIDEVIGDPDMVAPQPFEIQRSVGFWTSTGYELSNVFTFNVTGPVQRAEGSKELTMTADADINSANMVFWARQIIYTTRSVDDLENSIPVDIAPIYVSDTEYRLDPPVTSFGLLSVNGLIQVPTVDYNLSSDGSTITFNFPVFEGEDVDWNQFSDLSVITGLSDIIRYACQSYRIMAVKHYPGSGYWRAVGSRLSTI